MATTSKTGGAAKDNRKSSSGSTPEKRVVILRVRPDKLKAIVDPASVVKKEASPSNGAADTASPTNSTANLVSTTSNPENVTDSSANTPAAGTPTPQSVLMGPPIEGSKKRGGTKRGAAAANDEPKLRGKPGPKKKQRLEDGTIIEGSGRGSAAHKLGPRGNMGAINAGLRALDRSGTPCRKWNRGGFVLKSFTGVTWEISRWTAPPKSKPSANPNASAPISAEWSSGKENKDNGEVVKSEENSNNGVDVEMQSTSSLPGAPSPSPMAIAAA